MLRAFRLLNARSFSSKKLNISNENVKIEQIKGISEEMKKSLKSQGLESLFPIQAATFDLISSGKNLLAKAKTGTGKTLAFLMPIIELCAKAGKTNGPKAVIMTPTRELARQVSEQVQKYKYGRIFDMCVYGGVGYDGQMDKLRRGVDILVGTPGRILDLIGRGSLSLADVKMFVLDEADHMLDIGFKTEMEEIFESIKKHKANDELTKDLGCQVLLFSATVPSWIHKMKTQYLGKDSVTVDLVGDDEVQANENIKYIAIPVSSKSKLKAATDIIRTRPKEKVIIFTSTKVEANNLANTLSSFNIQCGALHGDLTQGFRDQITRDFKSSKIRVLVATDIAARGLDVPNVDLVIQYDLADKVEPFLHRSGRTGRAGNSGTCITLFDYKKELRTLKDFEKRANIKFEIKPIPRTKQILEASMADLIVELGSFDRSHLNLFDKFANKLTENMEPTMAIKSLMAVCCNVKDADRSAITGEQGQASFLVKSARRLMDQTTVKEALAKVAKRIDFKVYSTASSREKIVDVPVTFRDAVLKGVESNVFEDVSFEEIDDTLPELEVESYSGYGNRSYDNSGSSRYGSRDGFSRSDSSRSRNDQNNDRNRSRSPYGSSSYDNRSSRSGLGSENNYNDRRNSSSQKLNDDDYFKFAKKSIQNTRQKILSENSPYGNKKSYRG